MTAPTWWIRPLRPDEEALLGDLLAAVSRWVRDGGYPGAWPIPFPMERIRPRIAAGDVYLAGPAGGGAVATITLQWDDPPVWGERPPDAGYVHRLAVAPSVRGAGWGRSLMAWAEAQTRARGRPWLRLDCAAENPRIRRYYAELGFREVGARVVNGLALTQLERWIGRGPEPASSP